MPRIAAMHIATQQGYSATQDSSSRVTRLKDRHRGTTDVRGAKPKFNNGHQPALLNDRSPEGQRGSFQAPDSCRSSASAPGPKQL